MVEKDEKAARLAAALRENLRKRKAQARGQMKRQPLKIWIPAFAGILADRRTFRLEPFKLVALPSAARESPAPGVIGVEPRALGRGQQIGIDQRTRSIGAEGQRLEAEHRLSAPGMIASSTRIRFSIRMPYSPAL
jgi:hypothetical protein